MKGLNLTTTVKEIFILLRYKYVTEKLYKCKKIGHLKSKKNIKNKKACNFNIKWTVVTQYIFFSYY